MNANDNSCFSVKGNDLEEPENILFGLTEPNFKGQQYSIEINLDGLMHQQDLQNESDLSEDERLYSQDSGGSTNKSSFEISCEDIKYNSGEVDKEAQLAPSQKLPVLKKTSARRVKCSGLSEALADSMEPLIEIFSNLTGIFPSSFREDLLKSFAEFEAKDTRLKKVFKKEYEGKKERNWEDKDAITKSIGSLIKKIPNIIVNMDDYFPKRNHGNRTNSDFLVAYLKAFMLEFAPLFLVKKREFEEDFD